MRSRLFCSSVVAPDIPDLSSAAMPSLFLRLLLLLGIGILGIAVVYGINCLFLVIGGV